MSRAGFSASSARGVTNSVPISEYSTSDTTPITVMFSAIAGRPAPLATAVPAWKPPLAATMPVKARKTSIATVSRVCVRAKTSVPR